MTDNTETKRMADEQLAVTARIGDPIVDYLKSMPPHDAMHVLLYVVARCFLSVSTKSGISTLEGFDRYMAVTRQTIEMNLKQGLHS